jgi:hypothetical protein
MSQIQLGSIDFSAGLARDPQSGKKQHEDVAQRLLCLTRTPQALGQTNQDHSGIKSNRFGRLAKGPTVNAIELTDG